MNKESKEQLERLSRYAHLIEKQTGKAVRPYRSDGYVNVLNRYGTEKDTTENYQYQAEPMVSDEELSEFYESNGLFAKIIDAPAEEALKKGFELQGISDDTITDFYSEALEELDWKETAITALKWSRLFGGAIAVLLVNDGRGIDEPLDWKNIKSIDDMRVYDRSVIHPDFTSMFSYNHDDPFRTRGSRLGMPEYYHVYSRYGSFVVHESRCLVFQNGVLPENCSNSTYQMWGMPEYIRLKRAIRDSEIAHGSGPKLLEKSVQAIYKMKNLAAELATEQGEERVLRRLQTIDLARGLLNSIAIDGEGEEYDFKTFQFNGVSEIIDTTCNQISALTSIPQTILFGRSPAGMNSTGESDLENWYSFVERIQERMLKSNLRYLLSIIFQAGVATGEIDEVPKIKVEFSPLWTMSEMDIATLEQTKANTQQIKANTAQVYVNMQAIDPSEVRNKLAESEEFDVENMLDDLTDEDLFGDLEEETLSNEQSNGNSPDAAPAATKLPQDMTSEELAQKQEEGLQNGDSETNTSTSKTVGKPLSVGVLVVYEGLVLTGVRTNDSEYGLICGPGGHIENGETPEQAAFRETEEEFGISPNELIPLGYGPQEKDSGLTPAIYLCTDFEGSLDCVDKEMSNPQWRTLEEIHALNGMLFQPFEDSITLLERVLSGDFEAEENNLSANSFISDNTIDNSVETAIIKSKGTSEDGAPKGNKNAAGPHKKKASSTRKQLRLGKKEYASVCHEIDTYYHGKFDKKVGKSCSVSIGNNFYLFENHGYNTYRVYKKISIEGNEDEINTIRRKLDEEDF